MSTPLSEATMAVVRATVPALAAHGHAVTTAMYRRLFRDEHIAALFNHANQDGDNAQAHALAGAIVAYARNIDDLGALSAALERIAQKHVGYHILPEHYPFVARALLGAIEDVLGDAATPQVLAAWGEAYWLLADLLKRREAELRGELAQAVGGWSGWREFVIAGKRIENAAADAPIASFELRPADGGAVIAHRPGQYLTLRYPVPGQGRIKRNYSISCGPNREAYRITVKREARGHGGSRHLHDAMAIGERIELTPPAGDFFLPDAPPRPVVLLSGGVGLTPMVSMLEAIAARHPRLRAHYVHGTADGASHAMAAHVQALARAHGGIQVSTFYAQPGAGDALGRSHQREGLIDADWLRANVPLLESDVYLCGPRPFLRALVPALARAGVADERVHYEFFGPSDERLAA
ncbi:NO-inducible flavohemoprotein [Lysobacter enzymogenes]|uniref:nitric oxide dioxygenase n=1 Tax=Lysobacter enzymogenes TaxID=69 RepID=A0A3N2RFF8_LYSEN|nr:NO-inducible flavohemoprotein [Lysobacter enzymogenes]ROU06139.1 NO-inducible flavohemoprotein [Lysobacter enzymogenes]